MTRKILLSLATAALGIAAITGTASDANAARWKLGTEETLHRYAETGVTSGVSALSLCYKATTYHFGAPAYTTDEKVLCDEAQKKYWPVPTGSQLKKFQSAGHMPNPIPDYKRPAIDYVLGYSLWLILAAVGAFTIVPMVRSKGGPGNGPEYNGDTQNQTSSDGRRAA